MKRSAGPGDMAGPSQKRLSETEKDKQVQGAATKVASRGRQKLMEKCEKHAAVYKKVVWSGSLEICDSSQSLANDQRQKKSLNCCIKLPPRSEEFESEFWPKQLKMHIVPPEIFKKLHQSSQWKRERYIISGIEDSDTMSHKAFVQSTTNTHSCFIAFENTPSTIRVLCFRSISLEDKSFTFGKMCICSWDHNVTEFFKRRGIIPHAVPHAIPQQYIANLKKELQLKDKMLAEQQRHHQEEVKMQKILREKEEKALDEERGEMEKQFLEKERAIDKLTQELTKLRYEKDKIVENISNRLKSEYQCPICREILIEASRLPWCGHKFCNYCVTTWLKEHANCPLCKGKAESPIRCIALDEIIDNMICDLSNDAKEKRRNALQDREETICIGTLASSSEELEEGSMMSEESSTETAMSEEEGRSPERSGRVREGPRANLTDSSGEESSSDGLEDGPSRTEQDESTAYLSTLPSELALSSSSSSSEDETLS